MNWLNKITKALNLRKSYVSSQLTELQKFSDIGIKSRRWWGTYQVEASQSKFWRVGDVVICVDRVTNEWHIASYPAANFSGISDTLEQDQKDIPLPTDKLNFKTFTFRTQAHLELQPVLPDLPLASKLERPLYIPGGEDILLYVSSPVWVRVQTGSESKIVLAEIPTMMLSDTWFGPNTREGELCYAGHTHCSTHLQQIPSGPDRIISPMFIKNHSPHTLMLEKVSVPLPYLSVYSDEDNFLWTEQLYVYHTDDTGTDIEVAKGPPKALNEITLLTRPRVDYRSTSGFKQFFINTIGG